MRFLNGWICALALLPVLSSSTLALDVFATSFFDPTGMPGDSSLSGLLKVDLSSGVAETFVPSTAGGLTQPTDVVYDQTTNTVYVSTLAGKVWHYDATTADPRPSKVVGEPAGVFAALPSFGPGFQDGAASMLLRGNELLVGTSFGSVAPFDLATGQRGADLNPPQSLDFPSGLGAARSGELIVATGDPQYQFPSANPGELYDITSSTSEPIVAADAALGLSAASNVTVLAPAADFDLDGSVTQADLAVWVAAYGSDNGEADANFDGLVDAADYTIWRDTLGEQSRILVADTAFNRLLDFALDGTDGKVLTELPPLPEPGAPGNFPSEILLTPTGTLLVSAQGPERRGSNNSGAFLEFSRDGTFLQTYVNGLPPIGGMALAPMGVPPVSIPEPAALVLLGLAGLPAWSRGRRR